MWPKVLNLVPLTVWDRQKRREHAENGKKPLTIPIQNDDNWSELSKTVFEILLAQILMKLHDQMS